MLRRARTVSSTIKKRILGFIPSSVKVIQNNCSGLIIAGCPSVSIGRRVGSWLTKIDRRYLAVYSILVMVLYPKRGRGRLISLDFRNIIYRSISLFQCVKRRLGAAGEVELVEDVAHMGVNGLFSDHQIRGDLLVALALRHQPQGFHLAWVSGSGVRGFLGGEDNSVRTFRAIEGSRDGSPR